MADETRQDAFGRALEDYLSTAKENVCLVERKEDGTMDPVPTSFYFDRFEDWIPLERALAQWIRGRVLDVGMGAGRLALWLEERGHEVVSIDRSPRAVEVARKRGVRDARRHDILVSPLPGETFDTIALFGYNLGIAGTAAQRPTLLASLVSMLRPGGLILGDQINYDRTSKQNHLAFHRANREAGRHPAEMTLRLHYADLIDELPWCLTNQEELVELAEASGLSIVAILDCGEAYGYVLGLPPARDQE